MSLVKSSQLYIYKLPYQETNSLCHLLDQDKRWEDLGLNHMHFDEHTIENLKKEAERGNSPSIKLLRLWADHNHTVLELYIILHRICLYQGMRILKHFVDPKYHTLIKEDNVDVAMGHLKIEDSQIPNENFYKISAKNVAKDFKLEESNDCNISNTENTHYYKKESHKVNHANHKNLSPGNQGPKDSSDILTAYVTESAGATPQIPYEELQAATDNWNVNRILGQGGFGTVFKGLWKCTQVAIKRLEPKENTRKNVTEQIRQSVTELHCLNAYRHDNILPLYGYSIGGQHPCLIYQYMPGGSLDCRIRTKEEEKLLSWHTRLNIAIGTARGLQFLHTTLQGNKPLIHGDIKSANILLDPMDQPRIGDFGLAREGPDQNFTHMKVSRVHGTLPYLPDEFLRAKEFSTKIDTYSFGVVLFELATALAASDKRIQASSPFLKDYVTQFPVQNVLKLKDSRVPGNDFIFKELIRIGKLCVSRRAKDRPEMINIYLMLEEVTNKGKDSNSSSSSEFSEDSSEE